MRIKKGDLVKVTCGGSDRKGRVGRVLDVDRTCERVQVEGVAEVKRHLKPQRHPKHPEGGIITKNAFIHVSNVMLMSETQARPVRIGIQVDNNGKKRRVARGKKINHEIFE